MVKIMTKAERKIMYQLVEELHKKYPNLSYDVGFGLIYYIVVDSIANKSKINFDLLDKYYNKIESIDYYDNGYLITKLSSNNSKSKSEAFNEIIGEELYDLIMTEAPQLWGHLADEIWSQYTKVWSS